ncbi:MAG TPA: hypothetical protein VM933_01615 [Acidimicrobiales bacterium]|nr:hypothetical protein [Acidimicrobiales bacterium]
MALPYDQRPIDTRPVSTADLPSLPQRDRSIPASAWREAPGALLTLGEPFGGDEALYKRRIGGWLLWRSGPATKADAAYLAIWHEDLALVHTFRLLRDGTGDGTGPSGQRHTRFRTWKEDLRDHQP